MKVLSCCTVIISLENEGLCFELVWLVVSLSLSVCPTHGHFTFFSKKKAASREILIPSESRASNGNK